jgi:hypothetical protein
MSEEDMYQFKYSVSSTDPETEAMNAHFARLWFALFVFCVFAIMFLYALHQGASG